MTAITSILLIIAAIFLYWAFGYAHELAYAKFVKKSIPKTKKAHTPLLVRGYIWGMWYMVLSLFFFT